MNVHYKVRVNNVDKYLLLPPVMFQSRVEQIFDYCVEHDINPAHVTILETSNRNNIYRNLLKLYLGNY